MAAAAIASDLSHALGAPPVALGDVVQRRHQAEGVVAVVTPVAQEEPVLVAAAAAQEADVQVNLQRENTHEHRREPQYDS